MTPPNPPSLPPQPPTPAPRPSFSATGFLAIVAVLLCACLCGSIGIHIANANNAASTSTTSTTSADISAPTATSIPTPVPTVPPTVSVITGATLGGLADAFTARYGPLDSAGTWDAQIAGSNVAIYGDPAHISDTTDGQPHFYVVQVVATTGALDVATQAQVMSAFLPPDARPVGSSGAVHLFQSDQLAATFHDSMFTNEAGTQQSPSGSLYWLCATATSCAISVGTP